MQAESLLAVTGLAPLLAGKPKYVTVADGERAARLPNVIRRAVRRFLHAEAAEKVDRPAFDYDALAEQLTAPVPAHVVEDLIDSLPADADLQAGYAVAINRALAYLQGAIPLRSTDTAAGPERRRPPDLDIAKFKRAWEIAESPLVALGDLEAGRLVPDQVRAFAAMYPDLYSWTRMQVLDGIVDAKGDAPAWKLDRRRDRSLQVLLQAQQVDAALRADIAKAFQPREEEPPARPAPQASKVADAYKPPSAQPGV
jgi:hypothetical protein